MKPEPQSISRTCWPVVWLWIFSIAQYGYRYILQVNDPRTSHLYGSTPGALSALKYEIFILFVFYASFRFWRRPVQLNQRYRTLLQITGIGLMALVAVLLVRMSTFPGELDETLLCALQLIPWIMSVFFVPLVVEREHSITQTLQTFERVSFWIVFPFWLATVALAAFDIRYPALSYPGILVRYGGIMDDPNGYACLCLLLLVLSVSIRAGTWKWRAATYVVMLLGTLSFSGYATGVLMCLCWLFVRLARPSAGLHLGLIGVGVACVATFSAISILATAVSTDEVVNAISSIYSAKSSSARMHLSDLAPNGNVLEDASLMELLCGSGGFSENFYWRVLANFGLTGLLAVVSIVLFWSYHALWRIRQWRYSLGIWGLGVLIGSNGIAYLLVFPLSLIYWSALSLLICAGESKTSIGQHNA
ncbi:MAG: hypothetical protein JO182_20305 [Acidobacteriaceae bacterium]|nr:hypothetical protein [Acidobacteriaceae bacterium]